MFKNQAKASSMIERGDVYLAHISFPIDLGKSKTHDRYVVILQSEKHPIFRKSPTIIVVPLTTQRPHAEYPTDIYVPPQECGYRTGARITSNQLYTIDKTHLIIYKYTLSQSTIAKLDCAIALATGLIEP
jgi:mRNA-degrading endonuclease toxin of MazEF toxin-antitoxin module